MAETQKPKAVAKPAPAKKSASKPTTAKAAVKTTAKSATAAAPKAVAKIQPPKGEAGNVKSKVKSDMNDFKAQATDSVRAAATKGKDRATEAVGSIGKLIRDSAATIDDNVGKQYGDYARSAADMVDGFADTPRGRTLAELFDGRRQLLVYHFMFAPEWTQGCKSCSLVADHYDPATVFLAMGPLCRPHPWADSVGSNA